MKSQQHCPSNKSKEQERRQESTCPRKRLEITARIARQLYDAEKTQFHFLQGASLLHPVFKELEIEKERRRYLRQKETVESLASEKVLKDTLPLPKARDLFWAFTGRDFYRMLVIEQNWPSDAYEKWLADLLIQNLLQ